MPRVGPLAAACLLVGSAALVLEGNVYAQDCPPGSDLVERTETDRTITFTCRCSPGFWVVGNDCVASDSSAAYEESREDLSLLFDGVLFEGLEEAPELQDYALEQDWPLAALSDFLMSTQAAVRGYFERAKAYLGRTRTEVPDDEILDILDELLSAQLDRMVMVDQAGPLVGEVVDPDLLRDLPAEAQSQILEASVHLRQGDYDGALAMYDQALGRALELRHLDRKDKDHELIRELRDAMIWTRQLQAQRAERLEPGRFDQVYLRNREAAAADRAWELGTALLYTGKTKASAELFEEALPYFEEHEPRTARLIKDRFIPPEPWIAKGMAKSIANPPSKAWAILDALEYGKGDWDRSLSYIETMLTMAPENMELREALAYVQGASAVRSVSP